MPEEVIRDLTLDGLTFSYRLLRQPDSCTEPVIVLGGVLQGMRGWPQMEDHVLPHASLITADLPGMGGADPPRPEHDSELLCTAVDRIIDDLGAPRVNLFGYSYGSVIAFTCAQRRPQRIARLLLGGLPVHISEAQYAHWRRATDRLVAGDLEDFAELAAEGMLCLDESRPVHRRHLAYRYVKRSFLQAATHTPDAKNVLDRSVTRRLSFTGGLPGVSTLVFCGEHDTVSSPEHQRDFAAGLQDGDFVTVDESDHWVVLERPDAVADLTTRFFTGRPVQAAAAARGVVGAQR
ncbi:alpha/beta fold hydrolase [Saccharopolyspora gloriosae]|uniref:alpha/beta fold hydrolase n=1 Tax=Saccharopolyspora gloriosae TaxID=455344 RepID=UPI001FB78BBE|nr:alpha/beta fold hydrolase [Saccharopolyspora gloriosae]